MRQGHVRIVAAVFGRVPARLRRASALDLPVNPAVLYGCLALAGVGVALALPRRRVSPQALGAVLAAGAMGGVFFALARVAGAEAPGFFFYLFSFIALGASLRVITHPKPVYSALYFILTILSSSALYLLMQAEFMAFALIIIYAGAILITYLFVIMLADQAPSPGEIGETSEYDRYSREPLAATVVGFVLLGVLSGMLGTGIKEVRPSEPRGQGPALLERMPMKVLGALERTGAFAGLEKPVASEVAALLDAEARTIELTVRDAEAFRASLDRPRVAELMGGAPEVSRLREEAVAGRVVMVLLPREVRAENLHGVGFALVGRHPMALELAGVILLMAMLGAVVLARKQIEIGEDAKAQAARGVGGGGA